MSRSWPIIGIVALALLGFGIVMVTSAGISVTEATPGAPVAPGALSVQGVLTSRAGQFAGLSLGVMLLMAIMPVRTLSRWLGAPEQAPRLSGSLTLAGLIVGAALLILPLLLVYTPLGYEANNSRRWLSLPGTGGFRFQPSEIAKWGCVLLLAWYVCRRAIERQGDALGRFWLDLGPALIALGAIVVVIMKEDLGTAALVAAAGGVVLLAAGMRWWHVGLLAPAASAVLAVGLFAERYRLNRIATFLDPFQDPQGSGYHMIQSMATVAGGEVTGRGLGHGLRKFGYLPEDTTDFVFAVVCEELGVFGALLVLTLYAVLLGSVALVAWNERHPALRLICVGIVATIGLQASINVAVVTGLAPTKGIALPLISMGGTGWVLTAACLGLVMAIARTQRPEPATNTLTDDEADPDENWDEEEEFDAELALA